MSQIEQQNCVEQLANSKGLQQKFIYCPIASGHILNIQVDNRDVKDVFCRNEARQLVQVVYFWFIDCSI